MTLLACKKDSSKWLLKENQQTQEVLKLFMTNGNIKNHILI